MTVEDLLAESRKRLRRLTPSEAQAAMEDGARLIDLRSESQRATHGIVPGSHYIPRNVLEWRLDPECPHRDAALARRDSRLVLICDEGYQSSLAAATLQRFGLAEVTDVIGGFRAWLDDGLPVRQSSSSPTARRIVTESE
jgi:rhodanese-related sulfurtransferase